MTPAPEVQPMPINQINLTEKAVTLAIERKYLGSSRSVRPERVTVIKNSESDADIDRKWMFVSKTLLTGKELNAIWTSDSNIAARLQNYCLPSLFKRSMYLLPNGLVPEVDKLLLDHQENRKKLVDAFILKYEEAIAEAKIRLGALFNEADYPPKEVARACFRFRWNYWEFGVSNALKTISPEIFKREAEKVQEQWIEASTQMRSLLRVGLAEQVAHLSERLTPDTDGKKKVFRANSLQNIQDFIATFDARNLTDDKDLQKVVEQIKGLTQGLDAASIRTDEALRDAVTLGFAEIKTKMDTLITEAPTRAISFED